MSCKDQGKGPKKTTYENSAAAKNEILSPNMVVLWTTGVLGNIQQPEVFSPAVLHNRNYGVVGVLRTLVTAEKVARRQYDETMLFSRFPELRAFEPELLYIRNDEYEHELILECIIQRLMNPAAQPIAQPKQLPIINYKGKKWYFDKRLSQIRNIINPNDFLDLTEDEVATLEGRTTQQAVTLTPQALGEFYETILDRFGEEEEKSVKSYEELLVKVQQSKAALGQIQDSVTYDAVATPLNELERKINKHLNEERVHLDVIDTMQEMFSNMKLGKVY